MPRAAAASTSASPPPPTIDSRHRQIRQRLARSVKEEDHTVDIEHREDDDNDRTVQVEARGGRTWYIVVDTPGGHCDSPLTLVPCIEREYDEESEEEEYGDEYQHETNSSSNTPSAFTSNNSAAFLKVTQMMMANRRRGAVIIPVDEEESSKTTTVMMPAVERRTRASVVTSRDNDPLLNIPVFGPLPHDADVTIIVEECTDPSQVLVRTKPSRDTDGEGDLAAMALLHDDESGDDESLLEGFGERKNRRGRGRNAGGVRKFFRNRFRGRKKKGTEDVFIIEDNVGHGSMYFNAKDLQESTKDLEED